MKKLIKHTLFLTLPYFKQWLRYNITKQPAISYSKFATIKLFGSKTYWARHKNFLTANSRKVFVGVNSSVGRPGCYIQGAGEVYIGNYVRFAINIGILSSNHDLYDQNKYNNAPIIIGDYSWIGMNSIITAGVELGPRTIVGAGAVVTKSFPEGFCVMLVTQQK